MKQIVQKTLVNRRKLTFKDYLKNNDVSLDKNVNRENKEEKMLLLDSAVTSFDEMF